MSDTNNNTTTEIPGKAEAKTDQAIGSAKETVGDFVGDTEMKNEGHAQNVKGHGKEAANDITGFFTKISHEVEGTFKGVFNALSGKSSSTSSAGDATATEAKK
jgi:uncharacterized protein YjbJ (UPF0337 family)